MCGKEVYELPQGRESSDELLRYGRVKLILKPLHLLGQIDEVNETSFDLCEDCRGVIEEFVSCVKYTMQEIEKNHLTVEGVLKEIQKAKKSTNLPFLKLMSKLGNVNAITLKFYQFFRLRTEQRIVTMKKRV